MHGGRVEVHLVAGRGQSLPGRPAGRRHRRDQPSGGAAIRSPSTSRADGGRRSSAAARCSWPRTTTCSSAPSPATSRRRATASSGRATATRRSTRPGRSQPRLITLDLVLPGLDGWQVLKELKADPRTARIPVIVVSLVANHELGFALGADDYFVKPLDRARVPCSPARARAPSIGGRRPLVLVIDDDRQMHDCSTSSSPRPATR